jgi:hypothetical protein
MIPYEVALQYAHRAVTNGESNYQAELESLSKRLLNILYRYNDDGTGYLFFCNFIAEVHKQLKIMDWDNEILRFYVKQYVGAYLEIYNRDHDLVDVWFEDLFG